MTDITDSTQDIWKSVLTTLRDDERITPQLQGFLSLVEPKGVMAGTLYLEVPNDLTRGMLEQRIRLPLLNAITGLDEDHSVSNFAIVVNPEIAHDALGHPNETTVEQPYIEQSIPTPTPAESPTLTNPRRADSRLNPKYNFDNFVIGSSNRFAHAAAVAVAEAPAKAYNPLFIYGDSGLGKTHLLHAIGHYAESLYPGIRVRYVSSEEFTNDFINSIANNRASVFQSRYREIDILLIDDVVARLEALAERGLVERPVRLTPPRQAMQARMGTEAMGGPRVSAERLPVAPPPAPRRAQERPQREEMKAVVEPPPARPMHRSEIKRDPSGSGLNRDPRLGRARGPSDPAVAAKADPSGSSIHRMPLQRPAATSIARPRVVRGDAAEKARPARPRPSDDDEGR